jgi:phage tail-like protein
MAAPVNVRNTSAPDPYLNFKFLVSWAPAGGADIAGVTSGSSQMQPCAYVSKISALTTSTQVVSFREGGAPQGVRRIPGQTEYGPITLERGVTLDVNFEQWANKMWYYPNTGALGNEVSLKDFRKDIMIELMNQAGQVVLVYYAFSCWPSEYIALPELDSSANSVAIQTLTLQNEGWIRDDSVQAPTLPSIATPTSPLIASFTAPAAGS